MIFFIDVVYWNNYRTLLFKDKQKRYKNYIRLNNLFKYFIELNNLKIQDRIFLIFILKITKNKIFLFNMNLQFFYYLFFLNLYISKYIKLNSRRLSNLSHFLLRNSNKIWKDLIVMCNEIIQKL